MDGITLARIGTVVFVALALVATAIKMNRHDDRYDDPQGKPAAQVRPSLEQDPLEAELARCSTMGEPATRDLSCLKAWDQNRRRFLGQLGPAVQLEAR